jgi:hypothetical protein
MTEPKRKEFRIFNYELMALAQETAYVHSSLCRSRWLVVRWRNKKDQGEISFAIGSVTKTLVGRQRLSGHHALTNETTRDGSHSFAS